MIDSSQRPSATKGLKTNPPLDDGPVLAAALTGGRDERAEKHPRGAEARDGGAAYPPPPIIVRRPVTQASPRVPEDEQAVVAVASQGDPVAVPVLG
jgi:hypothetical protein